MDKYRRAIENEVVEKIVDFVFRLPETDAEQQHLELRIREMYCDVAKTEGRLPSAKDIYTRLWISEFGLLSNIVKDTVEKYADFLSPVEKTVFYDLEIKDLIAEISYQMCTWLERKRCYKVDVMEIIMDYVVKIGYAIFESDPELSSVNIVSGDAQLYLDYDWDFPCTILVANVLANINKKGGVLLGE